MKFMVSCRQPLVFLKQVDEIRVNYVDIERLADFVTNEWTCKADVVVYIPKDQLINWTNINTYKDVLNIIIAVEDTSLIQEVKDLGYKVFWSYPAATYWELQGLLDLGVDQVLLDAPLYFDLPNVKRICGNTEIRLVVNKCMNGYMRRKDGVCGTYVRPEDVEVYEPFVAHMEFDVDDSLQKEYTLYNIYAKNKNWPGDLNILLTYLNKSVDNRGFETIPNDENDEKSFAHRRLTCKQKCQSASACNFCYEMFNLINAIDKNSEKLLAQLESLKE